MADATQGRSGPDHRVDPAAPSPSSSRPSLTATGDLTRVEALRWLAAILALAAVLRSVGLTYQLPVPTGPDHLGLIAVALRMGTGDLNPHMFTWPAAPFYVMAACFGAMFGVCRLLGIVDGVAEFKQWFLDDPTAFFMVTRLIMVTIGLLSVAAMYRLGCALGSRRKGLLAAAMLAVTPAEVILCHYQKAEPMLVLATILGLWALVRWWQQDDFGRVALAGAAIGLAVAVKYNAALLVVPALATWIRHAMRSEGRSWRVLIVRRLLVGVACMMFVFVALNPYLVLDASEAMRQLTGQKELMQHGMAQAERFVPAEYLRVILPISFGWVLYAAFAVGSFWLAWRAARWRDESILLLAFILPYTAAMMSQKLVTSYYPLPLVPALALGTAGLIETLRRGSRLATWAFVVLLAHPTGRCVILACELALPGPIFKAEYWIASHVPPGDRIAHNHWLPPILPTHRHAFGRYPVAETHPTVDDVRRLIDSGVHWFVFNARRVDDRQDAVFGPREDRLATEVVRFDAPDTHLPLRSGGITIWRASQPTDAPPLVRVLPGRDVVTPPEPINATYEHGLVLLGVDRSRLGAVQAGRVVEVATYWHVPAGTADDLLITGQIRGAGGVIADLTHRFGYGAKEVADPAAEGSLNVVHRVLIRPARRAKPGAYEAVIGLRDGASGRSLAIIDGPAAPGEHCKLAELQVVP